MNFLKLKKTIYSLTLLGLATLTFSTIYSTTSAITPVGEMRINNQVISFTETTGHPILLDDLTYVPIRPVADALDYTTLWDQKTQTLSITRLENSILLTSNEFKLIADKTYVPLRFVAESLGCEVTFQDGNILITSTPTEHSPIDPWTYQKLLGKGMDVDWSKTHQGRTYYNKQAAQDFKEAGLSHVRIRIKDAADDTLFTSLDQQIKDCLEVGLIPVIAYQADEFKNEPSEENIQKVVNWWGTVAKRYQDVSHLLSFDLLIEATDALNKQPEKLNEIYERLVTEIRKTNPTRIIMISPRLRSDAAYLHELKIPSQHNNYLMAEWHFYASGPSKTNERKLWTTGTDAEKALILEKINLALDWQKETGVPTWVGAWMPGNYNDGNDYTIPEQVTFASYMSEVLTNAGIPFAVNSDTKFYNRKTNEWVKEMQPVYTSIFTH